MAANDSLQREVLPIPDRKPVGLTTYDAKDPETKFPPITQLRPLIPSEWEESQKLPPDCTGKCTGQTVLVGDGL